MLRKVSVGTKCLSLERIPRYLLIFEEINKIILCCFQVRFGSLRILRYLTQSLLSRITFIMVKKFYGYVEVHFFFSGMDGLQNLISLC